MDYKEHTVCRVCGHDHLTKYLDLGKLPLSNNLASSVDDPIHDQRYPLQVLLCENCGLSQLSIVVQPEVLFSHYVYRSSISSGYIKHCREMAQDLRDNYGLMQKSFVIDIAGNDGALLKEFKDEIGCMVLNVDPAENLAKICENKGVRMFCQFWGMKAAQHIADHWPKADIITATNVFAHIDNVTEFIEAAKMVLSPRGKLILEFPYLIDFIENGEFDTIYFEHLSYFSIGPLRLLCAKCGMNIEAISKQDIHGGSVRVTIGYGTEADDMDVWLSDEEYYQSIMPYHDFERRVSQTLEDFNINLNSLPGKVAAFAASAKGNTLLNCVADCTRIEYIIDETPEKIGKFSPGVKIPIVPLTEIDCDYLVILSWNFATDIIYKCRSVGYKGKFVIPIPKWQIIE